MLRRIRQKSKDWWTLKSAQFALLRTRVKLVWFVVLNHLFMPNIESSLKSTDDSKKSQPNLMKQKSGDLLMSAKKPPKSEDISADGSTTKSKTNSEMPWLIDSCQKEKFQIGSSMLTDRPVKPTEDENFIYSYICQLNAEAQQRYHFLRQTNSDKANYYFGMMKSTSMIKEFIEKLKQVGQEGAVEGK